MNKICKSFILIFSFFVFVGYYNEKGEYMLERGEFEIAFAIAAILLVLTFIINMSAKMAAKILKKGRG